MAVWIIDCWKRIALALILTLIAAGIATALIERWGYWGLVAVICAVTVTAGWALRNWS